MSDKPNRVLITPAHYGAAARAILKTALASRAQSEKALNEPPKQPGGKP